MDLKRKYFSKNNIEYLNKQIVLNLYKKTGNIIETQETNDMIIVMQYIYNKEIHSNATLDFLNAKFLEELIPNLLQSFQLHLRYLKNLESLNGVNDYPLYESTTNHIVNKRIL